MNRRNITCSYSKKYLFVLSLFIKKYSTFTFIISRLKNSNWVFTGLLSFTFSNPFKNYFTIISVPLLQTKSHVAMLLKGKKTQWLPQNLQECPNAWLCKPHWAASSHLPLGFFLLNVLSYHAEPFMEIQAPLASKNAFFFSGTSIPDLCELLMCLQVSVQLSHHPLPIPVLIFLPWKAFPDLPCLD